MNDMHTRPLAARFVGVALALGLLAGCSDVVSGTGSTAAGAGSSSPDFPSPSAASTAPGTSAVPTPTPATPTLPSPSSSSVRVPASLICPTVHYTAARYSFTCLTTGLTPSVNGTGVWPLREYRSVEPSTGWVLETGGGHWGPPAGKSLVSIATTVRQRMVSDENYGSSPTVTTVASTDTTLDGMKAHILQTTMTLNPAFRTSRKTKVKQEKLWIVALQVGSNDVSLWYTSLPDLVSNLWPKVPAAIKSIRRI